MNTNQWIAENVMGWKLTNYKTGKEAKKTSDYEDAANNDGWTWSNGTDEEAWQFQPETKPEYAMDVFDKLLEVGLSLIVEKRHFSKDGELYTIQDTDYERSVKAPKLHVAICLMAMKHFNHP